MKLDERHLGDFPVRAQSAGAFQTDTIGCFHSSFQGAAVMSPLFKLSIATAAALAALGAVIGMAAGWLTVGGFL